MKLLICIITTLTLLLYFYFQDTNREPIKRLVEAFIIGAAISLQVSFLQLNLPAFPGVWFQAFILAGLIEETIKLTALRFTLFRNPDFTQPIDGITYAVFLSMGFATVENIVLISTMEIGIIRAFTATPAHALFAVSMGYWLGKYRFDMQNKKYILLALFIPVLLHGVYNFLIMSGHKWGLILFVPYVIFLWVKSTIKIDKLNKGVFKN